VECRVIVVPANVGVFEGGVKALTRGVNRVAPRRIVVTASIIAVTRGVNLVTPRTIIVTARIINGDSRREPRGSVRERHAPPQANANGLQFASRGPLATRNDASRRISSERHPIANGLCPVDCAASRPSRPHDLTTRAGRGNFIASSR
jgi:hypothetical protein